MKALLAALAAAVLAATALAAHAEEFPKGPITLVIPLAPGDASDIAGRTMGDELSRLGYPQNLLGVWLAFFAPGGLPAEVTSALVPAIEKTVRNEALAARSGPWRDSRRAAPRRGTGPKGRANPVVLA